MKTLLSCLLACTTVVCAAAPVEMPSAQKKKLNTFFSNFSEAFVPTFKQGALTDEVMVEFAQRHLYINAFKSLKKSADGSSVIATASQVDTVTLKYFGRKPATHDSAPYSIELADGEAFTFSQIDTLDAAEKSTFRAVGTIFTASSGGTPDVHATPAAWKKAGEEVSATGKFKALIQKDGERYLLLEYVVTEL